MSRCPHRHGAVLPGGRPRAVFLDRDGVLIEDTGYPDNPAAISLLPGVGAALRRLAQAGWTLVVVTNQSGVARGHFGLSTLAAIHERLLDLLAAEGVQPAALYFCPHHAHGQPPFAEDCDHRKPAPGMLRTAAADLALDLHACWMVGDKEADVQAGHAAGCRAVRVGEGPTAAEHLAPDLETATGCILAGEGSTPPARN